MFSYIKVLDICENNITITFNGNHSKYKKIFKELNINSTSNSTIIHKINDDEFYVIICQNKTCSKKLKEINEIKNYLENLFNV